MGYERRVRRPRRQADCGSNVSTVRRQRKISAVVLSEGFWRNRFGADPAVVGGQIRLDGMPFTVVGVVPQADTDHRGGERVGARSVRRDIAGIPGGPKPRPPSQPACSEHCRPDEARCLARSGECDLTSIAAALEANFRPRTKAGVSSSSRSATC